MYEAKFNCNICKQSVKEGDYVSLNLHFSVAPEQCPSNVCNSIYHGELHICGLCLAIEDIGQLIVDTLQLATPPMPSLLEN